MLTRWHLTIPLVALLAIPLAAQEPKTKVAIDSPDAVKNLQKGLHEQAAARTNPVEAAFLLRTRIDAIGYKDADKKEIEVKGVRLDYAGFAMKMENWNDIVPAVLDGLVKKHINTSAEAKLSADLAKAFVNIDMPEQPRVLLQGFANKKGIDDVYFASCSFNVTGELQIDGLVGKSANRPELEKAIRAELDGKPGVRAKTGPFANADRLNLSGIKEVDWTLGRNALQAWFASQSKDGLDQFRIDRLEYAYQQSGEKSDKTVRLFVKLKLVELRGDAKTDVNIHEKLSDQILGKNWEAFTRSIASLPAAERKEPIVDKAERATFVFADERGKLQSAIAGQSDLDGTLVWGKARFDSTGKLELNGVLRGGAKGTAALEGKLKDTLARLNDRLAAGGINASKFATINSEAVLDELANWAATTLDDVRIERLYFDAAGKLMLKATASSKEDGTKLEAQFRALLTRHEILKKLDETRAALATAEAPAEKRAPAEAGVSLTMFAGSLTADLQKFLAEHAREDKWRGILIGRGFFNPSQGNRYSLSVIVDDRNQEAPIRDLVKEFAAKPTYAGYLRKDDNPVLSVEEISLRKLVTNLREAMPAYPMFDRFRVDDSFHDAQRNLVLILAGVGTPETLEPKANEKDPIGEVRQALKKMLDEHPVWKKRSAVRSDSRLVLSYGNATGPAAVNYDLGPLTAVNAARTVTDDRSDMRNQVRTALMHNPSSSTLWYLSAAYHNIDKREDLALRDLRRVVLLEKDPEFDDLAVAARKARIRLLEPFQGDIRQRIEKLLDQATLDYKANKAVPGLKANP
jgi:hypothetical protein